MDGPSPEVSAEREYWLRVVGEMSLVHHRIESVETVDGELKKVLDVRRGKEGLKVVIE